MNFTPKLPWFPIIDVFFPRKFLFRHVKRSLPYFKGTLLDIGCGVMPYRAYIKEHSAINLYVGMDLANTEIYNHIQPDITWDGVTIPLKDGDVDCAMLTEVLEHCPEPELVLKEAWRVLKPGGSLVFSVPFIWYLHESPWDFYRYTPFAIQKMFNKQSFSLTVLETYGSVDISFLHSYFIWLKRGSLPLFIRFTLYCLSLPLILFFMLLGNNRNHATFKDGKMFIGIVGIAKKD